MAEELADPLVVPIGRRRMRTDRGEGFHWFGFEDLFSIGLRFEASGDVFIKLFVGTEAVWGTNDGVKLNHTAFVSFFGTNWSALWLESFPDNVQAESVSDWWPAVSRYHQRIKPSNVRQLFQERWDHFRYRHCLSDLLLTDNEDLLRPEIWFVNVQSSMLVDVPELALRKLVSIGAVMNCIERACSMIVAQMSSGHVLSTGESSSIDIWRTRQSKKSPADLVLFFTGIDDPQLLDRMSQHVDATDVSDIFSHKSEILAAARMRPAGLRKEDINTVFDEIDKTAKVETALLDDLSEEALDQLVPLLRSNEPPFVQGAEIASWLRMRLNYEIEDVLNPDPLLRSWNVVVREFTIFSGSIDAIALWGPRHGPAVLINRNGKHAKGYAGKRATLAHEVCHLLVDRKMNLPLADVVGGSVPEVIEQRARSFAAELLLPQRAAYDLFLQTDQSLHEVSDVLSVTMKKFRVSRWVAAYQLQHGIRRFHADSINIRHVLAYIDAITSLDWMSARDSKQP
jgi:Zn-dependent peptidase ImmA (M78 family)